MIGTIENPQYTPRDYQAQFINSCLRELAKNKTVLGQLPTGGGKTICFNEIIRRCQRKNYRVLILAHREELIKQAQEKLFRHCGVRGGIIMGAAKSDYSLPVQIASVQSLVGRAKPKKIKLIITDECHHATASSYKKIYAAYPDALHLGVTATPVRANGEGFDTIYKSIVTGPQIKDMQNMKFLCPAKIYVYPLDYVRVSNLDVKRGDYDNKQLAELMNNQQMIADAVASWKARAAGKQTIGFAVNVAHSKAIVEAFNAAGIKAAHIDGETPKETRRRLIQKFSNKEIMYLCNVGIATEGTDIPQIECVQVLRPTKSLSLYLQMVGRGARIFPGKKEYILLDHSDLIWEHGRPDDDRKWVLKGKKKGKREKQPKRQYKIKLDDGSVVIVNRQSMPQNMKGVELIPLNDKDVSTVRLKSFNSLMKQANRRGFKPYWAFAKWMETQPTVPTIDELNFIGARCGYKSNWGMMKHKELKQIFQQQSKSK